MRTALPPRLRRIAVAATAVLVLTSACTTDSEPPNAPVTSPPLSQPEPIDPESRWQPLTPRNDLRNEQTLTPEEVVPGSFANLLVRFWGGVEPCFGARVAITEDDETVNVRLITGLPPGAEVTTCIALAVAYQIDVPLAAPLGTRALVIEEAGAIPAPNSPTDAVFLTDQYLGLTLDEAEQLAAVEQRVLRIARIDDEAFGLTEDFDPSRVNIEIENGIVVAAEGW